LAHVTMGLGQSSAFAPDPSGTLLADGSRWGVFDPEKVAYVGDIDRVLMARSVDIVASGFRWTEGPTWLPSQGALLFSDTIDARVYRWTPQGVSVWMEQSGGFDGQNVRDHELLFEPGSNGMALEGDALFLCQHATRRVVKVDIPDVVPRAKFCENNFTVVADAFRGTRLNSPNDVIVGPDGKSAACMHVVSAHVAAKVPWREP